MFNQSLQYLGEGQRNQWLNDQHNQSEAEESHREALEAQMAFRQQTTNAVSAEKAAGHGPYALLKAAFSHLPGHRVATSAR